MVGSGKTVGVILLAVGIVIFIVAALFIWSGVTGGNLTSCSAALGCICCPRAARRKRRWPTCGARNACSA
jgi:hypothetical protein